MHGATRPLEGAGLDLLALVAAAPDGICLCDADGHLRLANPAACRLFGRPSDDLLGRSIAELLPAGCTFRPAGARGDPGTDPGGEVECRIRRGDCAEVVARLSARALPGGGEAYFLKDVTRESVLLREREAQVERIDNEREWLKTVLDVLPLGVLLFREDGKVFFNARTEALLGMRLSPEGGSAQYADRIRFPDGTPVPPERLVSSRVLRSGELVAGEEYLVARPDGKRIPVLGSAAPLRAPDGRVIGGVGVFQDMSERMRLEEAVRANERLLQEVIDIMPVGVWIADRSGRIVRTNPAGERFWKGARYVGIPEFSAYRGWWLDSGKPIAAEEWGMARAITRGETSVGELIRVQCFDGSFKTMIHHAAPLKDPQGAITGAIVVNEDITALQEVQERHLASERLLRTVFELLPVGVWVADREGRITLANPEGERIWAGVRHVGPEQYAEYEAYWVESGKRIGNDEWALGRAVRHGETSQAQLIRIRGFDGTYRTVINWAAPIRAETGEIIGAIAVNDDVSELQHSREQLRAAVRDREQMLAIVTHDLRSPLSAIMTTAAALAARAAGMDGGAPLAVLAQSLVESARRMGGMVEDLLAVSVERVAGASMLRFEPAAGQAILDAAAQAARTQLAGSGLELQVLAEPDLSTIRIDRDRILRVFANLVDNARKFTAPPGRVTLAGQRLPAGVRYCVSNSGPAITAAEIAGMFQPFWQAKRDHRGAGLGLSICRSIVEAHGGSIWAEPAARERVRVCFDLPA